MAESSKNSDSSKVNHNACCGQLSECEIERMIEKFNEYKLHRERFDFPNFCDDSWDDSSKEKKYWKSRFKEEYMKLEDELEDGDRQLVADIADYFSCVTGEMLLRSDDYPDDYNCAEFKVDLSKSDGEKPDDILRNLKKEIEDAKRDDDFEEWSKGDKNKMNKKFMYFVDEYFTRDLRKDDSYKVEFDDDLKEAEYWVARFNKEYEKMKRRKGDIREHLAAYIHYYVEKFASNEQLKGLTDPLDDEFLNYLDIYD